MQRLQANRQGKQRYFKVEAKKMKTVGILKIAASTLVLGTAIAPAIASNKGHEESAPPKAAAQAAQQARHDPVKALSVSSLGEAVVPRLRRRFP